MIEYPAYPQNDKAMYLKRVRDHRLADELVQGTGWESNGRTRGCSVGCTIHSYDHAKYARLIGGNVILARLQDRIFEGLPIEDALKFPEAYLSAMKPGADLSMVWPQFAVRMVTRCATRCGANIKCRKSVEKVIALYADWIKKKTPAADAAWLSAADAAWLSAADAAWRSAADAAWRSAADAAACAAETVLGLSADTGAASAAAAAAAADGEYRAQRDDLLELISLSPKVRERENENEHT